MRKRAERLATEISYPVSDKMVSNMQLPQLYYIILYIVTYRCSWNGMGCSMCFDMFGQCFVERCDQSWLVLVLVLLLVVVSTKDACFSGLSWLKYSQKWKHCRAQARPSWLSKQDSRAEQTRPDVRVMS